MIKSQFLTFQMNRRGFCGSFFSPCKTPTLLPQQMHLPVSSTPQKLTQEKGIFTVGRKICAKSGKAKGFHH
jgi:hypothetical protein